MTGHTREESRAAIGAVLNARSIAVVGASNDVRKFGGMTMQTLTAGGYDGWLYAVNPRGGEIMGVPVFSSLNDVPGALDAVVIIVPAESVPSVLYEAAGKGAKGAIIQSAGFREFGRADLEEKILAVSRETGIRLIGPNVQGVTYVPNKMCAMFFPVIRQGGPMAVVTQSGSVTTALCEWAERECIGISAAVNLGNQVDLCDSDFIDFFAEDSETGIIVLYLEGVKEGRRFLRSLEAAVAKKPVVLIKVGRTESGAKSAASHTGSLAGSHAVFEGACRQSGALVVGDLTGLYDAIKGLARISPLTGDRMLIMTTSGGAAALASDAAASAGFSLPPLPDAVREELGALSLTPMARLENPLDLPTVEAEQFLKGARTVGKHGVADVILITLADPVPGADTVVIELARGLNVPLVVSYMGGGEEELRASKAMQQAGVPVFATPEQAVRGIAAVAWRSSYLAKRGISPQASHVD